MPYRVVDMLSYDTQFFSWREYYAGPWRETANYQNQIIICFYATNIYILESRAMRRTYRILIGIAACVRFISLPGMNPTPTRS
jgi:hypothetical protein